MGDTYSQQRTVNIKVNCSTSKETDGFQRMQKKSEGVITMSWSSCFTCIAASPAPWLARDFVILAPLLSYFSKHSSSTLIILGTLSKA